MSPIGMMQETQKKTEISDVVAAIVKKRYFLTLFFRKSWKFLSEKSGWWKKEITKMELFFNHFLEIWQNRIFHWEWADRREKNESSL